MCAKCIMWCVCCTMLMLAALAALALMCCCFCSGCVQAVLSCIMYCIMHHTLLITDKYILLVAPWYNSNNTKLSYMTIYWRCRICREISLKVFSHSHTTILSMDFFLLVFGLEIGGHGPAGRIL